jgi:hypothetical protein
MKQDLERDLEARVGTVFERCPELSGFSVAERPVPPEDGNAGGREWELYVSHVAAYPELGPTQSERFVNEISGALADLLNQRPQAADLLPGRTFARVWH